MLFNVIVSETNLKLAWVHIKNQYNFALKNLNFKILNNISKEWFLQTSQLLLKSSFIYTENLFYSKKQLLFNFDLIKIKIIRKAFLNVLEQSFKKAWFLSNYPRCIAIQQIRHWKIGFNWILNYSIFGGFNSSYLKRLKISFLIFFKDKRVWTEIEKMFSIVVFKGFDSFFEKNHVANRDSLELLLFNIYLNDLDIFIFSFITKNNNIHKQTYLKFTYKLFTNRCKLIKRRLYKVVKQFDFLKLIQISHYKDSFFTNKIQYFRYFNDFLLGGVGKYKILLSIKDKINYFLQTIAYFKSNNCIVNQKDKSLYFLGFKLSFSVRIVETNFHYEWLCNFRNYKNKMLDKFTKPDIFLARSATFILKKDLLSFFDLMLKNQKWTIKNCKIICKFLVARLIFATTNHNKYFLTWKNFLKKLFNKKFISVLKFYTDVFYPIFNSVENDLMFVYRIKNLRDRFVQNLNKIIKLKQFNSSKFLLCDLEKRKKNLQISITAPIQDLFFLLTIKGFFHSKKNQPMGNLFLVSLTDYLIIFHYSCIINGLLHFYKYSDNFFKMKSFLYNLQQSCILTLRVKHKKSLAWCYNQYTENFKFNLLFKGNFLKLPKNNEISNFKFISFFQSFIKKKLSFIQLHFNQKNQFFCSCVVLNCENKNVVFHYSRKKILKKNYLSLCNEHYQKFDRGFFSSVDVFFLSFIWYTKF